MRYSCRPSSRVVEKFVINSSIPLNLDDFYSFKSIRAIKNVVYIVRSFLFLYESMFKKDVVF